MENSKSRSSLAALALSLILGCGGVATNTNNPPSQDEGAPEASESADPNNPGGNTAVILGSSFTDPVGTLNLIPINEPRTASQNLVTTHSDAVVRSFLGRLYVVNRLGADNIQVVDPADFSVPLQCSTGQGTNPQEILLTRSFRGYVTLYQPEGNSDLAVDDLLIVDPEASDCAGFITGTIDLTPLTADDGDRLARASSMALVGDQLFVAVQDLPSGFASPDQPGKIAVIDVGSNAVTGTVTLAGRNPVDISYSPETGRIYAAEADYADTSSPFGGIEVVNTETLESATFIDDLDLGGAPGDIEVAGDRGFVVVGFFDEAFNFLTKVVSFGLDPDQAPTLTEVYRSQGFIQDIAVDENGLLLVGDRDPAINGTLFIDPESGEVVDGPINTGNPPSSITFIDR